MTRPYGRIAATDVVVVEGGQIVVDEREVVDELDGDEVPDEVAIDEAVTLAKRYATEDAARLVNGILGRIVREKTAR